MKKVMFVLARLSLGTLCWGGSAREDATERLDDATSSSVPDADGEKDRLINNLCQGGPWAHHVAWGEGVMMVNAAGQAQPVRYAVNFFRLLES
jgi:hypothetical protein